MSLNYKNTCNVIIIFFWSWKLSSSIFMFMLFSGKKWHLKAWNDFFAGIYTFFFQVHFTDDWKSKITASSCLIFGLFAKWRLLKEVKLHFSFSTSKQEFKHKYKVKMKKKWSKNFVDDHTYWELNPGIHKKAGHYFSILMNLTL